MEPTSPDISSSSLGENIEILERSVPAPIQKFLHSPERDAVSLRLSQKYNLHADQAADFELAYIYMLLGVNTPEDFVRDLREAGLPDATVRGLTNDINELVFKPLQQQEFAAAEEAKTTYRSSPERPTVPVPHIAFNPPQTPVSPFTHEVQAPLSTPAETPPYNLIRPDVLVPAPRPVILHSMQADMEALKHPRAPQTLAPASTPAIFHPVQSAQLTPARSFQTASLPYSMPQPVAPVSVPSIPVQPAPQAARTTPASTAAAPNPPREYESDPYREPIS